MSQGPARKLAALQAALAAEEAAIYGYGVAGAHMSGSGYARAHADTVAHERARDALIQMIRALGAQPQPSAVAYQLPRTLRTAADARALAATLELQVAAAYRDLAAEPVTGLRKLGATSMQSAAVRAARWNGQTQAFPGLASTS